MAFVSSAMAVRVQCPNPNCGKRYRADESLLGQTIVCKHCGQEFTVSPSSRETFHPDAEEETGLARTPAASGGEVPKKIGRFEILSRLGSGAFGTVYRAHDPVLDREVALKVPRAAALERPEARARFLREPKAAAQLRHPNIVPVFDAGTDGDRYYIASAYIEGRTLEEVIDEGRGDFRRSARIISELAVALDYAHRSGVIHRDVKPANIMIDERGQALLMDFGLARLETSTEKITQDGSLMGTPAYMAPEQADRSFGEVGPASDQYSLGVVLYELLCGQPPFSGPPTILLFNTIQQEPPAPRTIDPEIPRDLETVCLKAIAKTPRERYRSCGALADDLRRWLADRPIRARRVSPWERIWRWCRRNPIAAVSASAALVFFVVTMLIIASVTDTPRTHNGPAGDLAEAEPAPAESEPASTDQGSEPVERVPTPPDEPEKELPAEPGTEEETPPAEAGSETIEPEPESLDESQKGGEEDRSAQSREASTDPGSLPRRTQHGERPPLAVAPFDAATAEEHQQAWANYLGLPVERDVDLGGGVKLTMVLIPPGQFLMGSTDEERSRFLAEMKAANNQLGIERIPSEGPQHLVTISRAFLLGKCEMTQAQWEAVMRTNPSKFQAASNPVEQVSWDDTQRMLERLNEQCREQGTKFVLPTEAQWEYACRAGTTAPWCCGDNEATLRGFAWFKANAQQKTHPVGALRPNAWGLHDMHGNVREWCADRYGPHYYAASPSNDPIGPPTGLGRVFRGGGWFYFPRFCRSAYRSACAPDFRIHCLGFRVASVLAEPSKTRGDDSRGDSAKSPSGPGDQSKSDEAQSASKPKDEAGFVSLFDGKTLNGWHGDRRFWRVENGTIVGAPRVKGNRRKTFLSTHKTYRDFILKLKFNIRGGNSGVQFRSRQGANYLVTGYQAEITAVPHQRHIAIYHEGSGKEASVCKADPAEVTRHFNAKWNEYVIECRGSHVRILLNDYLLADHHDTTGRMPAEGVIALQMFPQRSDMWIAFKDIRIKEL